MSLNEVITEGTLKPDGTLELDHAPNLVPGRVTVVMRQKSEATGSTGEDWWQFMQDARKRMQEAGCQFMDEKEMNAHIEWLREGDRIDDLLRDVNEQRKNTE